MAQIVGYLSLSNVFCNCHWRISTENITPSLMLDEARIETSYTCPVVDDRSRCIGASGTQWVRLFCNIDWHRFEDVYLFHSSALCLSLSLLQFGNTPSLLIFYIGDR